MATRGRIFVTGGAGYIGGFTVRKLLAAGYDVTVFDNLSAGHVEAVPQGASLVVGDLTDPLALKAALAAEPLVAVVHFAGAIEAGQSMTHPTRFYRNNVVASLNLIDELVATGTPTPIVFSSTAAIYGNPERFPILETDAKEPVNVYGDTKLDFEKSLRAYDSAYGLRSISLRYFNACGADVNGEIGEAHRSETHLIPLALSALMNGQPIKVFGTDYDTEDGTCIRDYVHVEDLADAHVHAVAALIAGASSNAYNVGLGTGFSVAQVLDAIDRVTGQTVQREFHERRAGDPAALVADSSRLKQELGWSPNFTTLDAIVETAWKWHSSHPDGY